MVFDSTTVDFWVPSGRTTGIVMDSSGGCHTQVHPMLERSEHPAVLFDNIFGLRQERNFESRCEACGAMLQLWFTTSSLLWKFTQSFVGQSLWTTIHVPTCCVLNQGCLRSTRQVESGGVNFHMRGVEKGRVSETCPLSTSPFRALNTLSQWLTRCLLV